MWCTCSVVVVAVVVDVVVVHFLDICTSKSGPNPSVFFTWKRASCHNGVQFIISHLARWLRARHFSEVTFRPSRATVNRDFPTFSRTCIFSLLTLSLLWSSHFFSISPYCRKFDFQTSFDNGMEVLSHFSALERKKEKSVWRVSGDGNRSQKIRENRVQWKNIRDQRKEDASDPSAGPRTSHKAMAASYLRLERAESLPFAFPSLVWTTM